MQVDDPPYLSVGTAVSAKYKGAFCEAKVSKVTRSVKCKITYKMGLGTATVSDNDIKGTLRVGHTVQARHSDKKEYIEAVIGKIQDCSQYTVVFDDGDITTLRRSALCLKSGRHFNESETLDQLPLTHPEHFGNPVMGGRRGRRNRQLKEESSDGEGEEENEPDLEGYTSDIGRVVYVESTEKKRNRDNWFPGLIVIPSAQPTVKINVKDEFLVRSFRDDRYYTVPKKEVREFPRSLENRVDNHQAEGVAKAMKYLDTNELPAHWERNSLFNMQSVDTDSDENFTDSSDDEPNEEKDRFVAQLYKFMDDSGTPLNKSPMICNKDVDLHRLFRAVNKLGGYNRVTNQNKWRTIANHLHLTNNTNTYNLVKSVYKRCLLSYESFFKTLGVTMLNHTRSTKKQRGRALIRDKDRSTPVNISPKPDKDDEIISDDKSIDNNKNNNNEEKKKKIEIKKEDINEKKNKEIIENSDTNSSDATDHSEPTPSTSKDLGRPRRLDRSKDKKTKPERTKSVESKKDDEDKQQTRSKSQQLKNKEVDKKKETINKGSNEKLNKTPKKLDEEKKRGRKKTTTDENKPNLDPSPSTSSAAVTVAPAVTTTPTTTTTTAVATTTTTTVAVVVAPPPDKPQSNPVNLGDKLKVYYGPTHESKVTYEAKVIEVDHDNSGPIYRVHYTGWNTRYDEWITPTRIAENLSATTKAKRYKQIQSTPTTSSSISGASSSSSSGSSTSSSSSINNKSINNNNGNNNNNKTPKRGRGMSITGRNTSTDMPRSTTPSSVTSSSSRTKTPPTPATTRSTSRLTRQDYSRKTRRSSAQTDLSNHSDTDTEISESESELTTRTRSGSKNEEIDIKTYRRKPARLINLNNKNDKSKDDGEIDKDDEPPLEQSQQQQQRTRRVIKKMKKSSPEKSTEESDDDDNTTMMTTPKGRDFDLNQIRSELKGFTKAIKVSPVDTGDKETLSSSSSDDSNNATTTTTITPSLLLTKPEDTDLKKIEISPSSEDIYEFKEPEPFEFESRTKLGEDKLNKKRLVPRLFEDNIDKSPKRKIIKSPNKNDKESPPDLVDKKRFRRTPIRKTAESDDGDDDDDDLVDDDDDNDKKDEDPFDKLVESPSFNILKSPEKPSENNKSKVVRNILEGHLSLFRELPETVDDYAQDMDLSDTESQTQPIFSREDDIYSHTFGKSSSSPDRTMIDLDMTSKSDDSKKESLDFESLRESITKKIERATSSDDSNNDSDDDMMVTHSATSYQGKKRTLELTTTSTTPTTVAITPVEKPKIEVQQPEIKEEPIRKSPQISPALQETDSSLMESICSSPPVFITKLEESTKIDANIKTSSKIAESILQKFNSIKNNSIKSPKHTTTESDCELDTKNDNKSKDEKINTIIESPKIELKPKPSECETKKQLTTKIEPPVVVVELKKKQRKILSKAYIEESDSDSSDSEQLVIARSDEDSQTNSLDKPDIKENDSNLSTVQITDDSQSQEEPRNFKFDKVEKISTPVTDENEQQEQQRQDDQQQTQQQQQQQPSEPENGKEEELHSLLICEETIPRSPAPPNENSNVSEQQQQRPPKTKLILEMPFASAPGSSNNNNNNNKTMLLNNTEINNKTINKQQQSPPQQQQQQQQQPVAVPISAPIPAPAPNPPQQPPPPPPVVMPLDNREAAAVLDNTPPTTPESTISNLSPRGGDLGGLSPNTVENESGKSNDAESDFTRKRRNSSINKSSLYSEDDSQIMSEPNSAKKLRDDNTPATTTTSTTATITTTTTTNTTPGSCRKRRRSVRCTDTDAPAKRGRKPLNRSRHNSDSDNTSEQSLGDTTPNPGLSNYESRSSRSPRPSKYNFFVEFDPSLDSSQRIAVLTQKLTDIKKTYADVKAELAAVERRRKKIRKREREALKASKQELVCA